MENRTQPFGHPPRPTPFHGETFCTGPSVPDLDPTVLVTRDGNRWSAEGEPTIYLASDRGVAMAEFGRHWTEGHTAASLWSVRVSLMAALDLRDSTDRRRLGLPEEPSWLLDRNRCRTIASETRAREQHDGLIVPSVAFLDDPSRWNVVVFVERLTCPLQRALAVQGPVPPPLIGAPHSEE